MIGKEFLSGEKLYGDDFSKSEITEWFKDEEEGYSKLFLEYKNKGYDYHELNKMHGYRFLKGKQFNRVLSFGGANGDELLPVIDRAGEILVIEPSKKLRKQEIWGKKIKYIEPNPSGKISLPDDSVDLITCFAVLHHIPNVSFVFGEFIRVLKKDGFILIREPIVSMGDWTKERVGLTKRERGIPLNFFRKLIKNNNLNIISERRVLFPLTRRLKFSKGEISNSRFVIKLDYVLSRIFSWNDKYHSTKFWHKIRPQSIFYVLGK